MYKALIADVDGTLVPIKGDGSDIDSETVAAVTAALRNGAQISVATGRGWVSTKPVVQTLGIVDLCIIEGGSCIIDPASEKIVWQKTLSADASAEVVKLFKRYSKSSELIKSSGEPERIRVSDADGYAIENRVIYLLGTDKETAQKVKVVVDALPSVAANITTPSWAGNDLYDVHVTSELATKKYAIEEWYRLVSITKEETVGMGDSANDLPLFQSVALRVAVGNATDDLKAQADYVAPNRQDGALRDVIQKYLV
jgi:Cof subfamily protein (haloacid dehalogenase superfamily)